MSYYDVLGVSQRADDEEIRKAYLTLVKRFPPDRAPKRFEAISAAYEAIKDQASRHNHYLFDQQPGIGSPFEALFRETELSTQRSPPGQQELQKYLRGCL